MLEASGCQCSLLGYDEEQSDFFKMTKKEIFFV